MTTLLRAIGLKRQGHPRNLRSAEEIKATKTNLKNAIGRRLAARVVKSWNEDIVDIDTGEVATIERNEVIVGSVRKSSPRTTSTTFRRRA